MSKRKASTPTDDTPDTPDTPLALRPKEACWEGVYRVNVVIRMLDDHDCNEDEGAHEDRGGFDLSVARDALIQVRELLRTAHDAPEVK